MNTHDPKNPNWTVGEITAAYKKTKHSSGIKISSSRDAERYIRGIDRVNELMNWREMFCILLLSRSNKIIGFSIVSEGGISGTVADPKVIFQHALIANASSIILCHNHPSGTTNVSNADRDITKKLVNAGKMLDLPVLDHIIITESTYLSMADEGILS